jgi:hypothetical protein
VLLDFLPEVTHVNAQSLHVGVDVIWPSASQELTMRQHFAGVQHKLMQQPVFARREFWIFA